MRYTGERVVPWDLATGALIMGCHVRRYAWAIPLVYGRRVADLGCGTGYGSFMLSWAADSVLGVDVDQDAVKFAALHFGVKNATFMTADIIKDYVPEADVYVAFEVLEHLDDALFVVRRFRPLVWSIPINSVNQWHKKAYNLDEIDAMMGRAQWVQSQQGSIVERDRAYFSPVYALGVTN